jgi:hypothetical protein
MNMRPPIRLATCLLLAAFSTTGCVRRTMIITTDPPHALVYLNDQEVGRSEVTTDFLWYGDYGVTIRMEGYRTLETNWKVAAPWYQWMPMDFFFEVLWPGRIHDVKRAHFSLEPSVEPAPEALAERAVDLRSEALPFGP